MDESHKRSPDIDWTKYRAIQRAAADEGTSGLHPDPWLSDLVGYIELIPRDAEIPPHWIDITPSIPQNVADKCHLPAQEEGASHRTYPERS